MFGKAQAEDAARQVLDHDPAEDTADFPEPIDSEAAAEAVRQLGRHLDALPASIRRALQGAERNAAQLSDDRLQGLAELIQNADDTGATQATFAVVNDPSGHRILFAHDGSKLRLLDVLGLATPWLSLKTTESDSLGRFGIGLMTLRALSDTIDVHCEPFHLRLGSQRLEPLPGFAHPAVDIGSDNQTVFSIPVRDNDVSAEDVRIWLRNWGDTGLLFLRNVTRIRLVGADTRPDEEFQLTRGISSVLRLSGGEVEQHSATGGDGRQWIIYSRAQVVTSGIRRNLKAQSRTTRVSVAFPQGHEESGYLHAGLPIRTIGLPFRVAAQFDPLANRREIADSAWNLFLITAISNLWLDAARHLFESGPAEAWSVVPRMSEFAADTRTGGRLRDAFERHLLTEARAAFTETVKVHTAAGWLLLRDLGIEPSILTDVLSVDDISRLAGAAGALPFDARDPENHWRLILEDLRTTGAVVPREIAVSDTLELLNDDDRPAEFVAGLTAAGLQEGLADQLDALPCLIVAEGTRIRPADLNDVEAVVDAGADPIWSDLEIGLRVHPAYAACAGWAHIANWLKSAGRMIPAATSDAALARLARAGGNGKELPRPLTDHQVDALRVALERSTEPNRTAWSSNIGNAIRLDAVMYGESGERVALKAKPSEAYLIERDANSWYVAARRTPGLIWLHRRYATELTTSGGRSIGAQRMFRLLGAEVAPRLEAPPSLTRRLTNERPALIRGITGEPNERSPRMRRLHADYTLDDHVSPDLDAVLTDIAADSDTNRRRKRADALLGTLARAWSRFERHTSATAVSPYYSWQIKGEIAAWWLLRAAEIPWLTNGRGGARPPGKLRRRTAGTVAVYGSEPARFVHSRHDTPANRVVLEALEVAGDPPASELVQALEEIRQTVHDPGEATAAAAPVYEALAAQIHPADQRHRRLGDLTVGAVREAFGRQDGLIATNLGWRRPATVLAGPPVFGNLRAFVSPAAGAERLWHLLGIRQPSMDDTKGALRQLAQRKDLSTAEQMIMHESLRLLAEKIEAQHAHLKRLPLWTQRGWVSDRPIFAVLDPQLEAAVSTVAPVWRPGGDLRQFEALIAPLGLRRLDAGSARVVAGHGGIPDDEATEIFGRAVRSLQRDLSLNDPAAEATLGISWDRLARYRVEILSDLRVRLDEPSLKRHTLPIAAWIDGAHEVLYLRNAQAAGRVAAGGYALASVFRVESRRIAHAWMAAWADAQDGQHADAVTLASRRAADAKAQQEAGGARLTRLRTASSHRQTSGSQTKPGSSRVGTSGPSAPPSTRTLVDPAGLVLANPEGQLTTGSAPTSADPKGSSTRPLRAPDLAQPKTPPAVPRGPVNYTPEERRRRHGVAETHSRHQRSDPDRHPASAKRRS